MIDNINSLNQDELKQLHKEKNERNCYF